MLAPGTTLTRNTANHNHDLGISAVPGVMDGGGNQAAGNGNPRPVHQHRLSARTDIYATRIENNDPDGARSSFQAALREGRRIGDRSGIAWTSLGLACLAGDAGDWHQAAVLHGVAQALLDRLGLPWEELEARYRQNSLDQVRAHLGQQQFERAYDYGTTLSFDHAFDLASGKGPPA